MVIGYNKLENENFNLIPVTIIEVKDEKFDETFC